MTIFISTIVFFCLMCACAYVSFKYFNDFIGPIFLYFSFIFLIIFMVDGLMSVYAIKTSDFYKNHYNIEYTPQEIFWNGGHIKTQIIGEKKRLEINMK